MTRFAPSPWAVAALYAFALVLVTSPLIDLLSTAWPPRFGDLSWRYGFFGLGAGYLHTPLIGLVLAAAVAYWREHRRVLRALGLASVAAAGVLVPVLALWPLDVREIAALRAEELRRGVAIGGVIQELKYLGACVVLGCLGIGALGTAASVRNEPRGDGLGAGAIVGRARK
jgi:hypothetical protein